MIARDLASRMTKVMRIPIALSAGLVAVLGAIVFVVVRLAGGSPHPLNHLGYAPILLAAYLYGWRGGLAAGIGIAVLLDRLPLLLGLPGAEGISTTVIRSLVFVGVGVLVAVLFDASLAATHGWRSEAATIANRQHEAMLALARGAEAKDMHTADHVARVQTLSEILAGSTGMDKQRAS